MGPETAFSADQSTVFDAPLNPERYLARVPPDALCKGMYFRDVFKAIRRVSAGKEQELHRQIGGHRHLPFKDYPLREHMLLTAAAVKVVYPDLPSREGMRRLGWLAYPTFAESLVGRVLLGVFGNDIDRIYELGPRSLEVSMSHGRMQAEKIGERHWEITFADIFGYLDTYYVGVVEGPILHHGFQPRVRLASTSLSDGVMNIEWR